MAPAGDVVVKPVFGFGVFGGVGTTILLRAAAAALLLAASSWATAVL